MGYLHEVIEFHALTDKGATHGRTVHTSVGTNLHIVLYGNDTYLRDLVVLSCLLVRSKAKAVSANHRAAMDSNIVSKPAVMVYADIRIYDTVGAYGNIVHHRGMRINLSAVADYSAIADIGEGSDIYILSDLSLRGNKCQRVDTLLLWPHTLIELQ